MKYGDNPNVIIEINNTSSCLLSSSSLNIEYFAPNLTDEYKDIVEYYEDKK
jgi:hypothetical protein